MENKNVFIALLLMLAVWTGYSLFFVKPSTVPPQTDQQAAESQTEAQTPVAEVAQETAATPSFSELSHVDVSPRDFIVETDDYRAVFSNVGGRLKHLELKHYRQTPDKDSNFVRLVDSDTKVTSFDTSGFGDFSLSADTIYAVSPSEGDLSLTGDEEGQLRFTAVLGNGVIVEKIYQFIGNGYDLKLDVNIHNQGKTSLNGGINFSLVQPWFEDSETSPYGFIGPAVFKDDKVKTYKIDDLEDEEVHLGKEVVWTIFENKYFMTGVVPFDGSIQSVTLRKNTDTVENIVKSENIALTANGTVSLKYLLYAGPRDPEILEGVNYELDKAIDFGFFDILARPLLAALNFCYNHIVKNYGVAIILLTVLIKILFWPLTHKSYKSMRDMQKLQPEMQRLREKYSKDKERMNKEIMELYRNNRVNPMGGCLPMFVQIPVFFALYKVLLGSIALRHEPFVFWIQDLSAKDPYYITPIIMGVTMFVQQKMSPTSMDSQQAKIMLVLPVVFTFMFLNFPSGLVLYWLVNNVLTIVQQWFINRGGMGKTQTA